MILHHQLKNDCAVLGRFELCLVLLMNDKQYPWFILVPQREGITEIHELSEDEQMQCMRESSAFAKTLKTIFKADKMNIAALGNMVPQLHIHHVVRFRGDPAWPAPIWGASPPQPYTTEELIGVRQFIAQHINLQPAD